MDIPESEFPLFIQSLESIRPEKIVIETITKNLLRYISNYDLSTIPKYFLKEVYASLNKKPYLMYLCDDILKFLDADTLETVCETKLPESIYGKCCFIKNYLDETGEIIYQVAITCESKINIYDMKIDNKKMTISKEKNINIVVKEYVRDCDRIYLGKYDGIIHLDYNPIDKKLFVCYGYNNYVNECDIETGIVVEKHYDLPGTKNKKAYQIIVSPDKKYICYDRENYRNILNIITGKLKLNYIRYFETVTFSPLSQEIVTSDIDSIIAIRDY